MKLLTIVLVFLVIGGFIISSSYKLNLNEPEDRRTFVGKFSIWVVNVGKNVIRTVGYAMRQDWLPEKDTEVVENTTEEDDTVDYTNYVIED